MNILHAAFTAFFVAVESDLDGTSLEAIGRRIEATREALGYSTQRGFASVCGLTEQAMNNYERGVRRPDIEPAAAMSRIFGSKLDWIYFGDRGSLPSDLAMKIFDSPERQRA